MKKRNALILAIFWFLFLTFLLCIPGQDVPSPGWLKIPNLDKPVHTICFFILVFIWCRYIVRTEIPAASYTTHFTRIAWASLGYGIAMEFIQEAWIPNRSFDYWDIVADAVGVLAGLFYAHRKYIKK